MRARRHCPAPIVFCQSGHAAKKRSAGAFAVPGSEMPPSMRRSLTLFTRGSLMTVRLPPTGHRVAYNRDRVADGSSSTNSGRRGFHLKMPRQRHPASMMTPRRWRWRRAARDSCKDWTGRHSSAVCPTTCSPAGFPARPCREPLPQSFPGMMTRSMRASMLHYCTTISGRHRLTSPQSMHAG